MPELWYKVMVAETSPETGSRRRTRRRATAATRPSIRVAGNRRSSRASSGGPAPSCASCRVVTHREKTRPRGRSRTAAGAAPVDVIGHPDSCSRSLFGGDGGARGRVQFCEALSRSSLGGRALHDWDTSSQCIGGCICCCSFVGHRIEQAASTRTRGRRDAVADQPTASPDGGWLVIFSASRARAVPSVTSQVSSPDQIPTGRWSTSPGNTGCYDGSGSEKLDGGGGARAGRDARQQKSDLNAGRLLCLVVRERQLGERRAATSPSPRLVSILSDWLFDYVAVILYNTACSTVCG